jgi:hypothetical protein
MMHGMPFRFFWIIPLAFLAIFLIRTFLFKRGKLRSAQESTLPKEDHQTTSKKTLSGPIPDELRQAGQQVLENLDWEIRLLEKQRLEAADTQARQEIEEKLKRKREEYHATADRLEP